MADPHLDIQFSKPMPPVGPLKSTENLLPGDIVRCIAEPSTNLRGGYVGEVDQLYTVDRISMGHLYFPGHDLGNACERFAFVSRPNAETQGIQFDPLDGSFSGGTPLIKAPGGVMISISGPEFAAKGVAEYLVGLTLPSFNDPADRIGGFKAAYVADEPYYFGKYAEQSVWIQVNTPLAGKCAAQPTADDVPPMPTEQKLLHCNPFTGKHGDRVRVTFEATIGDSYEHATGVLLTKLSDKFDGVTIELLDRPFAVGDRVNSTDATRIHDGEILCILNDQAWVKDHDGLAATVLLRDLTRA
jgi:hypothetical protein